MKKLILILAILFLTPILAFGASFTVGADQDYETFAAAFAAQSGANTYTIVGSLTENVTVGADDDGSTINFNNNTLTGYIADGGSDIDNLTISGPGTITNTTSNGIYFTGGGDNLIIQGTAWNDQDLIIGPIKNHGIWLENMISPIVRYVSVSNSGTGGTSSDDNIHFEGCSNYQAYWNTSTAPQLGATLDASDTSVSATVNNAGFETGGTGGDFDGGAEVDDGTTDNFDGWSENNTDADDLIEATATTHGLTGSYASKLTRTDADVWLWQTVTVTASTDYIFTFWCAGDGTNKPRYRLRDSTGGADIVATTEVNHTATSYLKVEVSFTTPVGCVDLGIGLYTANANGSVVYYDGAITVASVPSSSCTGTIRNNVLSSSVSQANLKLSGVNASTAYTVKFNKISGGTQTITIQERSDADLYNNSLYGASISGINTESTGTINIKDNIIDTCVRGLLYNDNPDSSDYNDVYNSSSYFGRDDTATTSSDLTNWQSNTTFGDNSIESDPLLDANNNPKPGSPCIKTGYNWGCVNCTDGNNNEVTDGSGNAKPRFGSKYSIGNKFPKQMGNVGW